MTNREAHAILNKNQRQLKERSIEIMESMKDAGLHKVISYMDALEMALVAAIQEIVGVESVNCKMFMQTDTDVGFTITFPELRD